MPETISLSLVSHTNVGKTTLARTLLGRDVGEVRDAPHVTEFNDAHQLLRTEAGDSLTLWDTPGFGDSVRLARRLRQSGNPLGWLLSQVWDRWRDRPFWGSQQVMRHVRDTSDLLLYLVNAAESPAAAGYVAAEMELLDWVGKPVLVLLNQLGPPRGSQAEADDCARWAAHLQRWPQVRAVLPLDAFARCWVQEAALWQAVHDALPAGRQPAMAALQQAWQHRNETRFDAAMQALADSVARLALLREPLDGPPGLRGLLQQAGSALGIKGEGASALQASQQRLSLQIGAELQRGTDVLLRLHGLAGSAAPQVLQRVAELVEARHHVPEERAAWMGGLVSGALGGLAADVATGGLSLGGGMLAGGLLGALGAAGIARGLNVVRGADRSWLALDDSALQPLLQAALLRYLAVAHFGRGRGDWREAESPPHWPDVVQRALAEDSPALQAAWAARKNKPGTATGTDAEPLAAHIAAHIAAQMAPLLGRCTRRCLTLLYPAATRPADAAPTP